MLAPPPNDAGENHVQDLILSCNRDGMDLLRAGRCKDAFDHFKYAEAILLANQKESDNVSLLSVTCNNLGCYYMKVHKYHGALSYIRRALKMEVELKTDETTLAGTHLNLCSILSKLGKPRKAVQHALCALELMHKRIGSSENVVSTDDYATLAVTYHNIGQCRLMQVEESQLQQQTDQAATAFQTGYQISKRFLGEEHPLTITLEKNCEAVLHKAKMNSKVKVYHARETRQEAAGTDGTLPEIASAKRSSTQAIDTMPKGYVASVAQEAADWANSEEATWAAFAETTLRGSPPPTIPAPAPVEQPAERSLEAPPPEAGTSEVRERATGRPMPPTTLRALAMIDMQDLTHNLALPEAGDMGNFRFQQKLPEQLMKQTPLGQALEDHPEALMDIIDAEGEGQKSMRYTPNDFRPNRVIKRSTRTSRVVRRTGVFNSSHFRDRVAADLARRQVTTGGSWKSVQTQTLAAQRIQRVWRSWFEYCQECSEWMTVTWICATMIQSHWRSYHVRRQKMDTHAGVIQRHCRGFLVRCVLTKHTAAVAIQKRVIGMLTRMKLFQLHKAAKNIQRLVRGGLARRRFRSYRIFKVRTVTIIQKYVRVWLAKKSTATLAKERHFQRTRFKAAIDLQRMFRGWKARQRVEEMLAARRQEGLKDEAATKIQSMWRRRAATRRVDKLRAQRLDEMERAATFLRKVWLGARTRKRYVSVLEEFSKAESQVITIQRYVRGFVVRIRLWREAAMAEDRLWGAITIQRHYRGYRGRVKAEDTLELVWRKEFNAAMIQRNARGWLARLQSNRKKRKIARDEFVRARRRYLAAQKIQSRTRGILSRKVTRVRHARAVKAATCIQRIHRGGALRSRLWQQVRDQRATMVQSLARGFLVRNRLFHLVFKVRLIQKTYRRWTKLPVNYRKERFERFRLRKRSAGLIQRTFREFKQRNEVRVIQAERAISTEMNKNGVDYDSLVAVIVRQLPPSGSLNEENAMVKLARKKASELKV